MAYDLRVIPISEFMRTDVSGEVDLNASRELLSGLMTICEQEKIDRILIDGREASSHTTVLDIWMLAEELGSLGVRRGYRVAVLTRPRDNFAAFGWLTAERPSSEAKAGA